MSNVLLLHWAEERDFRYEFCDQRESMKWNDEHFFAQELKGNPYFNGIDWKMVAERKSDAPFELNEMKLNLTNPLNLTRFSQIELNSEREANFAKLFCSECEGRMCELICLWTLLFILNVIRRLFVCGSETSQLKWPFWTLELRILPWKWNTNNNVYRIKFKMIFRTLMNALMWDLRLIDGIELELK